jgi:aldose sugar dehydrogenase
VLLAAAAFAQSPDAHALYKTHCAGCHGVNLQGGQHIPLKKDRWLYTKNPGALYRVIMFGVPGSEMPSFSKVLTREQTQAIIAFILERQDSPPGAPKPIPPQIQTADYLLHAETLVAEGFRSSPWGIEFLDPRRALITERRGGLRWLIDGKLHPLPIGGLPATTQYSDSGMLDIALDPNFQDNGWIYLAYVHALGDPSSRDAPAMTRILRGRVKDHQFVDQQTIFRLPDNLHFSRGTRWGSRLLFDTEGRLLFSIGDIGRNADVQMLDKPAGKVYRILPDGTIPKDNPYAGKPGALEAIFTIGNRNVQGLAQHPQTGAIWAAEHGPMGGDELNILQPGRNYGWPVITHGFNYDGTRVSDLTHKDGMEQPVKFWTPSPGLGPLAFYTGPMFPKWKNQAFLGGMVFEEIKRLEIQDNKVAREEIFFKGYGRVRDLKIAPDGSIYLLLNDPDKVVRLSLAP